MSPSATASSTPVTVTVCGTFQFVAVNVRLGGLTAPSVVSLLLSGIMTLAVGWLFSDTLKVTLPPASLVVLLPRFVTFTPAVSSSTIVMLADAPLDALVGEPRVAVSVSRFSAIASLMIVKGIRIFWMPAGMITVPLLRPL